MKNIWMLTRANFRKNKGQTVGIGVLMLITALFLNIGLVVFINVGSFYEQRGHELNSAHFISMQSPTAPSDAQAEFIATHPDVIEFESQDVLVGIGGIGIGIGVIVIDYGTSNRQMNPMTVFEGALPLTGDAIYLPRILFLHSGYSIGDTVTLDFMGENLDFTLAGSTEEIVYDGLMQLWRVHVPEERFLEIYTAFPENRVNVLSARLTNPHNTARIGAEYNSRFFGTDYGFEGPMSRLNIYLPISHENLYTGRTTMPMFFAAFITAFALLLLIIGIISIRFRITNSIDENMTNIGVLMAMGYLSRQIVASIVMQFGLVVIVSGIFGVTLSQILLPTLSQIIEPLFGLQWNPDIDFALIALSLASVWILSTLFSLISSLRINRLNALTVLRGGIGNHNFRKNTLSLQSAAPLTLLLAINQFIQNKKQAAMLFLIMCGLAIASTAGVATRYNMSVNPDEIVRMLAGEIANIDMIVTLNSADSSPFFYERMTAHPDVALIYGVQATGFLVDGVPIFPEAAETFEHMEGIALIDGRLPIHDNEIALTPVSLGAMGKTIGDWVTAESDGNEREFIITGIVQDVNYGGFTGRITLEGVNRVMPNFVISEFWVVLTDGADEAVFTDYMNANFGDMLFTVISVQAEVDSQITTLSDTFDLAVAIILTSVIVVVILVLYMVIKTTIMRRKRELGIQKAIGFTTWELMNQIALSLAPTVIAGVVTGAVAGYVSFSPLFVLLLGGLGITQANLGVSIVWIVWMCVAFILLAYVVAMLIARRIRKISAYDLVSGQ